MRLRGGFALTLALAIGANTAAAQVVNPCEGSPIPAILPELSEDAFVSYANGAIRLFDVYVDVHLPSSVLIGVLHPMPSDLANTPHYEACSAIYSTHDDLGYFGQVFLRKAEATYDAETGLSLTIPVRYDNRNKPSVEGSLMLTINQVTGTIDVLEN